MISILFLASGALVAMTVLAVSNLVWMYGTKACTRLINSLWWFTTTFGSISIQICHTGISTAGNICLTLGELNLVFTGCIFFSALTMIHFKIMPMRILLLFWTCVSEGFPVDDHMSLMIMIDVTKQNDDGDDASSILDAED